ncbi:MAG: hypothetical protein IT449_08070 [Phycisphaerales bacterium]|nr:hypothetical protein [Phycisphaerales bacterium]
MKVAKIIGFGLGLGLVMLSLFLVIPGIPAIATNPNATLLVDCEDVNTTCFDGPGTSWTVGDNWNHGVPDSTKIAVIPADDDGDEHFDVVIPGSTTAYCKTLTIEDEGDDRSTLFLTGGSTLVLGDGGTLTSTLDGQFDLSVHPGDPGTLKINGVHTIQGNGGVIALNKGSVIEEYTDGDDKLILKATSTCSSQSCSMTLHGDGYIKVNFDNRAYVVADDHIRLENRAKTGTDDGWRIVNDAGTFTVSTQITGASAWYVDSDSALNEIDLIEEAGCVLSTGPVTLYAGVLSCECGTTFCTSGKLTWKSVQAGGGTTEPRIRATPRLR